MLVARFSNNIEADIARGWSAWQTELGSYEDALFFKRECGLHGDIREFPEYPGSFGVVHHEGLSCYELEAETVEDAIKEVDTSLHMDGGGFGCRTIGSVRLLHSIQLQGYCRTLHILECDNYETEQC